MKKLIISEKPSVAQAIAKVLDATTRKNGDIENDDYIISWCIGHLVELDEPISYGKEYKSWSALPILPSYWNYRIKENTKSQFNILKKLLNDDNISEVICATEVG